MVKHNPVGGAIMNCPVCNSNKYELINEREIKQHTAIGTRYNHKLEYKQCEECRNTYLINIDYEELKKLYSTEYKKEYTWFKKLLLSIPYSTHYKKYLSFLKHLPKGKLLDVGSSEGKFLALMRLKGWTVEGIEPSNCAEFAQKFYKLKIHHGFLEEVQTSNDFDLVTCLGTFEHIEQPRRFLQLMKDKVKIGGYVFTATPCRSYAAEHLNLFSGQSLKHLFRQNDLEVLELHQVFFNKQDELKGDYSIFCLGKRIK
jgi:2-polyprenyl-3-methyl-5-hydroxy-6-metoxy-1,4-benzoquinol methylase